MAGLLIVLYAVAAIWNVATWVGAGVESQRFASAVPRLLQSVPRGSVVLVNVPEWYRDGWFWSWATPFALQPPFTTGDLYEQFKIVERPPVYCCPPDQWWAARKATLMALMDSPAPQQVASIVFDRENRGNAHVHHPDGGWPGVEAADRKRARQTRRRPHDPQPRRG